MPEPMADPTPAMVEYVPAANPAAPTDCRVATTPPATVGAKVDIMAAAGVPATIPLAPKPIAATARGGPATSAAPPTTAPPTIYIVELIIELSKTDSLVDISKRLTELSVFDN